MKNKSWLAISLFFLSIGAVNAQIETNTNSIEFEIEDNNVANPSGLELPARKKPSLTLPPEERDPRTNLDLGNPEPEMLNMSKDDGLLENNKGKTPKAFTKDKEPTKEFDRDQMLGEVLTGAEYVMVKYRDHEYVDGDLIRVYVNGDIVQSRVFLNGSFGGFNLTLEPGVNRIEFEALNQGSSGPNTAELHVYDDQGRIISAKEWNLLTGRRAIITVVKNK
ncbi:MAG: hypothetical protein HKN48_13510 [Flavobacteriaceae bacterium]|nr:hypothetical protein [Flavobacteriaceae bacterium]